MVSNSTHYEKLPNLLLLKKIPLITSKISLLHMWKLSINHLKNLELMN